MRSENDQNREEPESFAETHKLTSFKDLTGSYGAQVSPWYRNRIFKELQQLLRLAAPACLQLCAQQGLVVSLYSFWPITGSESRTVSDLDFHRGSD